MADVKYIVECDASGALKSIKDLDGAINTAAKTTSKAGGSGGPFAGLFKQFVAGNLVAGALRKGMSSLKGAIESCINNAIEAEDAENNLNAALETTGRNVPILSKHFKDYASALQSQTVYGDEAIMGAQTLLLQLTRLDKEGIDKATRASIGLASVFKMDLQAAATLVSKAMAGNVSVLSRYGITVDETLPPQEKQRQLLEKLEKLFGRARAETNTFGGALKQLTNIWGDVKEGVGAAITKNETVIKLIKELKTECENLIKSGKIEEWAESAAKGIKVLIAGIELLGDATSGLSRGPTGVIEKFLDHFTGIEDRIKGAKREAIDFVGSLKTLHPQMREVQAAMEAGQENWAAYVKWMREADEKATILAEKNKNLVPPINETGTAISGLTEENKKAIEAKKKLADAAQAIIDKYNPLQASIRAILEEKKKLTAAKQAGAIGWREYEQGIASCDEALRNVGDTIKTDTAPALTYLEGLMRTTMAEIDKKADYTADNMEADLQKITEGWKQTGQEVPATTRSFMDEVSTIVADSMRNIASSVVGMFNLQDLFGAAPKTLTFDSSYYDQMIAAATSAYDRERSLIERNNDARQDAARRAYSAQELLISRQYEDQDRAREREYEKQDLAYERQYEAQKRAIQNSKMTEKQKQDALLALETKYEDAKIAREEKREDRKVALERARENARLVRERAQEVILEGIRAAGLAKLLGLQLAHQADLDAIRIAEDTARQKQADDELKRQGSLWFKVKGIFATAVGEMATLGLAKLGTELFDSLFDKAGGLGKEIKDKVGGALGGLSDTAGSLASGLLSSLGSIGSIVSGITGVISLLKGPQKQTDVTYWLKLIKDLEQDSYNFYVGKLTWMLEPVASGVRYLESIKQADYKISTASQLTKDYTKSCRDYLKDAKGYLKSMDTTLGKLKGAQHGAVSTQTELLMVHGKPSDPEYTFRRSQMGAVAAAAGGMTRNVIVQNHFHISALDGADVERVVKNKVVPLLQKVIDHRGLHGIAYGA